VIQKIIFFGRIFKRNISSSLWILSIIVFTGLATNNNTLESPKIGLALGGGGAKGFAHLGVLKIIDSLNIPISYVAGTSIGAVMGGLYSAGYSASQIDSMVKAIDWSTIFSDQPAREKLSYSEKWETGRFQIPLNFNHFNLEPPSGLIAGQKVSLLLSRLLLPICQITNFDSLAIPFRCVAADLISGKEVILDKGSLAEAIRASISVPSVFTPVEWGDSLLVDGGVINNLPVDVLRKMGADLIIAIDVGLLSKSKEELNDAITILRHSLSLSQNIKETENMRSADVVISPNLSNYSIADFNNRKISEIVEIGQQTARSCVEDLKKLTEEKRDKPHFLDNSQIPQGVIYGVQITGNKTLAFSFIYQLLGIRPTKTIDIDLLENRIESLYGLGYFETINYQIRHHSEDRYIIHVSVKERSQNLARLGMRYQADKKIIAAVNLKLRDFPYPGIRNDITFLFAGLNLLEWELSYPRRFLVGQIYPYVNIFYRDILLNIFNERRKVARYHKESYGNAIGFGWIIGNWGVLKTEYLLEKLGFVPSIASFEEESWSQWRQNLHIGRVYTEIDRLNDPLIPQRGFKFQSQYEHTLGFIHQTDYFQRLYINYKNYFSIFSKLTSSTQFFLGLSKNAPLYGHFFLGGGETFVGKNYDEFAGPNIGYFRFENYLMVHNKISIGFIFNTGNIWSDYRKINFNDKYSKGYGVGIQINTLVGPFRYIIARGGVKEFHYITFGFNLNTRNDERM
jgi:predicted acylesterase/phospholipase RssA